MQMPAQVGNVTLKLRDIYWRSCHWGLDADKLTPEQIKQIDIQSE